jgi:hypothetical protein
MDKKYQDAIEKEFFDCAKNTLVRVNDSLEKNDEGGNYKPFHQSILIPEAILWSKFERSFSTSFGQRLVEEVSRLLALSSGASGAVRQKKTKVVIDKSQGDKIEEHCQKIKEGKLKGLWSDDLESISNVKKSNEGHKATIISDLWFKRDNQEYFFSIKTVKPNIDQTIEAKRDLLKLKINNSKANVYYGLYYNPWGEQRNSYKHNPPMKVFNFLKDEVVLIGKEYWDIIGGEGTYEELLEIAEKAGIKTKKLVESFSSKI